MHTECELDLYLPFIIIGKCVNIQSRETSQNSLIIHFTLIARTPSTPTCGHGQNWPSFRIHIRVSPGRERERERGSKLHFAPAGTESDNSKLQVGQQIEEERGGKKTSGAKMKFLVFKFQVQSQKRTKLSVHFLATAENFGFPSFIILFFSSCQVKVSWKFYGNLKRKKD